MSFDVYLEQQLKLHASITPQDLVKLCYQASHGPEHLLEDAEKARAMLEKEIEETSPGKAPLYELISDDYARLNIAAWKERALPSAWLFEMFRASAEVSPDADETFEHYLNLAGMAVSRLDFSMDEWDSYLDNYRSAGMRPVHHSDTYRELEHPAYRVVKRRFVRLLPILERAARAEKRPCIIAIDGRAASGKTTIAKDLSMILSGDVVHMDDFFLPPELRSMARLSEAGGNVHRERFAEEVLPYLRSGKKFSYRIFSCHELDYTGQREVGGTDYIIVEGSYSLHPAFGRYADVEVFSNVDPDTQQKRIFERDGSIALESFKNKWIPMEEQYFETFKIADKCDIVV